MRSSSFPLPSKRRMAPRLPDGKNRMCGKGWGGVDRWRRFSSFVPRLIMMLLLYPEKGPARKTSSNVFPLDGMLWPAQICLRDKEEDLRRGPIFTHPSISPCFRENGKARAAHASVFRVQKKTAESCFPRIAPELLFRAFSRRRIP